MSKNDQTEVARTRSRKRKALLAGGTVLGLGAAVTLAAWTDDVWVSGSFSAGTFTVQGAVDPGGAIWQDYDAEGDAGPLSFSVSPTAMSPGVSFYAPLNLRVAPEGNSYAAAITLPDAPTGPVTVNAPNTAFFDALRVTLYPVAPNSCSAGETAAVTPIDGFDEVPLTTTMTTTMFTLPSDSTPRGVCFEVSLPTGTLTEVQGGTTGPLTWNFRAESVEPAPSP